MNRTHPNNSEFYAKSLTNMELYCLGISNDFLNQANTLEELKINPPNIVIADCKKNVSFLQNKFKQDLLKKHRYVMGLGSFMQLHFDTNQNLEILKPSSVKFKNLYKPYLGQNLDHKTLLVFRTGGIGDLLFISPNLKFLKEKYPTSKIIFACGIQYQSMVKEWDYVDEVLNLPFDYTYLFKSDYHCVFEGVIERCKQA